MKLRAVVFLLTLLAGGLGPAQSAPSARPPAAPPAARPPAAVPAARPPAATPAARPVTAKTPAAPAAKAAAPAARPAASAPAARPAPARARPATRKAAAGTSAQKPLYRYVSEGEKKAIEKSGRIPNTDAAGKPKKVYYTDRPYVTAGRAKTHNQLPAKPAYRVEIDPKAVKSKRPMQRVDPKANPQWGKGGGVESHTSQSIKVDPARITPLKGAPKK